MVYLLHFSHPLHHARHYIGWCASADTFDARLQHHRNGSGARITQVATKNGIDLEVARTWPNADRFFERRLKNLHGASRICPLCNPNAHKRMRG